MDGRRISASPRPCSGRCVVAKKRPRGGMDGFVNNVKKLQRREISSKRDRAFNMSDFVTSDYRHARKRKDLDSMLDKKMMRPLPRDVFKLRQLQKSRGATPSHIGSASYGSAFSGELSGSTG